MVQKTSASETGAGKPKRGRPRAYEPDVALGRALETFRKDGYAATSLDDLSAATGMNRPSLYGAFGDKRELYIKTHERYRTDPAMLAQMASATLHTVAIRARDGIPRRDLEALMSTAVDLICEPAALRR